MPQMAFVLQVLQAKVYLHEKHEFHQSIFSCTYKPKLLKAFAIRVVQVQAF